MPTEIDTFRPQSDEAIVLRFDYEDIDCDEARIMFENVKSIFPNNTVVAIPKYTSLRSCGKDVLRDMVAMILEIIDNL